MPKNVSNEYTDLAVLNACAHAGLVDQARIIFAKTPIKTTKIYTSMVLMKTNFVNIFFQLFLLGRLSWSFISL